MKIRHVLFETIEKLEYKNYARGTSETAKRGESLRGSLKT